MEVDVQSSSRVPQFWSEAMSLEPALTASDTSFRNVNTTVMSEQPKIHSVTTINTAKNSPAPFPHRYRNDQRRKGSKPQARKQT